LKYLLVIVGKCLILRGLLDDVTKAQNMSERNKLIEILFDEYIINIIHTKEITLDLTK
jgi:hypothetical protein